MSSRSPSPRASSSGKAPEVELQNLGRTYSAAGGIERQALAGINTLIEAGRFTAIIGPSGCGKSTLLRLIGGLDRPDEGTVTLGGRDPHAVRGEGAIGFVPQTPALLPWRSVADNVGLLDQIGRWNHRRLSPYAVAEWLERVGLGDEAELLPHQLSGGMAQRAALARAFTLEPALLLMDEPFSALDELTRHQMQTLLVELCAATEPTVVFVTHSIDEAVKLADRVLIVAGSPGGISADVAIELDRPRGQGIEDSGPFRAFAKEVRSALMAGAEL